MNNISQTLNCKNIYNYRIANNLPVYDGGLGSNNIRQPDFFINSLKKFSNKKDYVSVRGIEELQKTLKHIYSNNSYLVDSLIVGNGLKELLFLLQISFVSMTNGIIFHITPSWVSYKEQILILNKESNLVEIETTIDNMFKIKPNQLEQVLSKYKNKSKMIIFNNPNNPTGVLYTPKEVEEISKILNKYECIVLADEIYFNINHNKPIVSISKFIPNLTIIGNSVSKDMGCGGYRIGWLTFPKNLYELSNKCAAYGSSIYSCAPTPLQYATNEMLKNKIVFEKHCQFINKIYLHVAEKTKNILSKSNLKFIPTQSSWYIFLDFSHYTKQLNKLGIYNSIELCHYLIEKIGLISVAGKHFNVNTLTIRVSLVSLDLDYIDYANYEFNREKIFSHMQEGFEMLISLLDNI